MAASLDTDTLARAVLHDFAARWGGDWSLDAPPRVRQMSWSTLYFLALDGPTGRQEVVAKIVHFPDQAAPEISWQSDELLLRGQREYESMARVYEHFAPQTDLLALRPLAYVPAVNAVVMEYAAGTALYDACATPSHLLTPAQRNYARRMMGRAGAWLRHLHTLPLDGAPPERIFGPADSWRALLHELDRLQARRIRLDDLRARIQASLSDLTPDQRVWTHGDFHMRNVLIQPGDRLLGFDTALERIDSPYADLGKFVADLQTRRARILRLGLLPGATTVALLRAAFLAGYFGADPVDARRLALYEGRFLFQKWNESLDLVGEMAPGRLAPLGSLLRHIVIDPTFRRVVRRWARDL
jgi:aminoglycoside phosphotransferase (APT) family kinase protein